MLFLSLLAILVSANVKSEEDRWIKDMFPTRFNVDDIIRLPETNGCKFILCPILGLTAYGSECMEVPQYPEGVQETSMGLVGVGMKVLPNGSFNTYSQLVSLRIDNNNDLRYIEAGVFFHLSSLKNLSISNNYNLESLDSEVFDGLINLEEFRFVKNNVKTLYHVTLALRPFLLPSLKFVDFSDNPIHEMSRDDFINMDGSELETLNLKMCRLYSIDPNTFSALKNLRSLNLDNNDLNSLLLKKFVDHIPENTPLLRHLGLASNLIHKNLPYLLHALSAVNVSSLDLSNNHFGLLTYNFFPEMPNVEWLDLSRVSAYEVEEGTFGLEVFPKLKHLVFSKNGLTGFIAGLSIPNIKELDLSENNCADCSITSVFTMTNIENMQSLEILDLSRNNIYQIERHMLDGFISLRALFLSNSSIYEIEDYSFSNLRHLEHLDLSTNKFIKTANLRAAVFHGLDSLTSLRFDGCSIESFPNGNVFKHLPNLKYLTLRDNMLHEFNGMLFFPLIHLVRLDMSNNDILPWNTQIFMGNEELSNLNVASNHIYKLSNEMMDDFVHIRIINMRDNPIQCNCDLVHVTLGRDTDKSENYFGLNDSVVKCFSPHKWSEVQVMEFIELNSINYNCLPSELYLAIIGICVLFTLVVCSVGGYYLRWYVRYWMFLIKQTWRSSFPRRRSPALGNYKYDAFVSYCNEDRNFVIRLVAMMENYEPYFRLCVFERDFNAGDVICETVLDCLAVSRKTIFILTDSFARSQWCQWELQMAQHKRFFFNPEGQDSLILIKLGDIMEAHLTPTLRYLIKTRVHLQWYPDPKRQRVFWQKLREALMPPNENEAII